MRHTDHLPEPRPNRVWERKRLNTIAATVKRMREAVVSWRGFFLIAGILISALTGFSEETIGPKIPLLSKAPVLDGKLDDACWRLAAKLAFSQQITGKPASEKTEAWLARDDKYLYLGFLCHESQIKNIVRKVYEFDAGIQVDDSVEVFLDPGTDSETYYHFLISASGAVADQKVTKGEKTRGWDSGLSAVVNMGKAAWTLEVAIPLYVLEPRGGSGKPWRINLCRNLRSRDQVEYISWAPGIRFFHDPEKFVAVSGMEEFEVAPVFAPVLKEAAIGQYAMEDGKYYYTVSVVVANQAGKAGEAEIVVSDIPKDGRKQTVKKTISLAGVDSVRETIGVYVPLPGDREAEVQLISRDTGRVAATRMAQGAEALTIMTVYPGRNYYTTEKVAQIHAELSENIDPGQLKGFSLAVRVTGQDGKVLAKKEARDLMEYPVTVSLPISSYQPETYQTEVTLCDDKGRIISQQTTKLVKRVPGPGTEVKVDHYHQALLLNGDPYYPVGFFGGGGTERNLKKMAEGGFNTFIRWTSNLDPEKEIEVLDRAHKYGIKIIERSYSFVPGRYLRDPDDERWKVLIESLPATVKTLGSHPATLAYYSVDEPGGAKWGHWCREIYRACREGDPYHPMYTSFSRRVSYPDWHKFNDIAGSHCYWKPIIETPNHITINAVATLEVISRQQVPAFINPNSMWYSKASRSPTAQEQRAVTYLTLVHGSRGTLWFVWRDNDHPQVWEGLTKLASEINTMAPTLLARTPRQKVTYEPDISPDTTGFPIVQASLRNRPEEGQLLLAVNSSKYPVKVAFEISSLKKGSKVKRLFGNRKSYQVRNGKFSDTIEGYGSRAYALDRVADIPSIQPIKVAVKVSGEAAAKAEERLTEERGGENLFPNPGFETDEVWEFLRRGANGDWEKAEKIGKLPTYEFTTENPHSGKRCCKFVRPHQWGIPGLTARIRLKPSTIYKGGFSYRTDITVEKPAYWGGPTVSIYDSGAKKPYRNIAYHRGYGVYGPTEWKQRQFTVSTGPGISDEVTVYIYATTDKNTVGTFWIDDLYLVERGPATKVEVKNILRNSSFEQATLPLFPDYWTCSALTSREFGKVGQDFTQAYHGKCSFRIWAPEKNLWGNDLIYKTPPMGWQSVEWKKPYVFSVYAKGERDGQKMSLYVADWYRSGEFNKEFALTTHWKRYVLPVEIPVGKTINNWARVDINMRYRDEGTIWVDGAQFEKGTGATPYAPSVLDETP